MENTTYLIISFPDTETIRNRNNYTFIIIILYLHCFFILILAPRQIAAYGFICFPSYLSKSMNDKSQKPEMVYVGGHISPELHKQMRIYSAMHDMRLRDVLALALENFLMSPKTPD
jgi:hypothetical protein